MPILAAGNTVASPGHVLIGNLTLDYFYQYNMISFFAIVDLKVSQETCADMRNNTAT